MLKYEIKIDGYTEIYTEEEMKNKAKELWQDEIILEEEYLEDMEMEDNERLQELKELDIRDIYDIEENQEFLFDRDIIEEIKEFNFYLEDLLEENDLSYNRSTMSKSTYIEVEDNIIRIADHPTPRVSNDYGHKIPTLELIYKDGRVENEDLKKHLNIDVEGIVIL